ncbi:MAG: transposase, partial [Burkholderiales bacterium]|nr:transposase [Burkholderiales bacterium]
AYRDGTTHIVMSALEFMQRLAALVPRPRLHLIGFHGVLAPHAKLRAAIVPDAVHPTSEPAHEHAHSKVQRMTLARLLKRLFDIDVEHCACGGQVKIIAAIEGLIVIVRILAHLSLPARAPPRARARTLQLIHMA